MSLMYIFIVHYTHCDAELFIQMQFESVVLYTTTDIIVDINHDTLTSQAGNPEHSTALLVEAKEEEEEEEEEHTRFFLSQAEGRH